MSSSAKRIALRLAMVLATAWAILSGQNAAPTIHFAYRPIGFRLENCETSRRHAPETMAGGVAVFDYNNDGRLDIFFTNGADIESLKKTSPKYSNRLFENDGTGHFTDVTAKAGLAGTGFDNAVAVGDYDNDGREDIFVGGVHGNHLYHNDGGTFSDVTRKAGLAAPDPQYGPLWSVGAAWVDVNNDGLLDLFVVNYLAWDPATEPSCEAAPGKLDYCHPKFYKPTPNQLFLNNGDGTFRDVSAESGIRAHPGKGMGIGVADYDLDGLMDIFVTNDKMNNSFFHNQGRRPFRGNRVQGRRSADGRRSIHLGNGSGFPGHRQRRPARYRVRGARSRDVPVLSQCWASAGLPMRPEAAGWPVLLCRWPGTLPRLRISTTTAGKTSL